MKKLVVVVAALLAAVLFSACGVQMESAEIALVTDMGEVDDKSFNQGTWEGVQAYAAAHGITHRYYRPAATTDEGYYATIEQAVKAGARVVVTPGHPFAGPVARAQAAWPEVRFVLIDATPIGGAAANTVAVHFAEEEAGYLAGYAAVYEGNRSLGFMGGLAVQSVVCFGFGFVQGAHDAAEVLDAEVEMLYTYTGTFTPGVKIEKTAAKWYADGVEVIFACGGEMVTSVFAAAEAAGAKAIGVDIDQSTVSEAVLTSAMKELSAAVQLILEAHYTGAFTGGQELVLRAADRGVGLPMATSRFSRFSQSDYDSLFEKVAAGQVFIPTNTDATVDGGGASQLPSICPNDLKKLTDRIVIKYLD